MRQSIRFLTILLLGFWSVTATAAELQTLTIGTSSFSCNTVNVEEQSWVNTTGGPIHVQRVVLWMGATGHPIDTGALLKRQSDQMILSIVAYDRYQPPAALHQWGDTFTPHSFLVAPGDELTLRAWCYGGAGINGQMFAEVWWTTTP